MLTIKCKGCDKDLPIAVEFGYCSLACAAGGSTANLNLNKLYKLEDDKKSLFEFVSKIKDKNQDHTWESEPLYKSTCGCGFNNSAWNTAKFCPQCGTSLEIT